MALTASWTKVMATYTPHHPQFVVGEFMVEAWEDISSAAAAFCNLRVVRVEGALLQGCV
ncbi:hypothetical protein [Streptomyces sp. NBC_01320]|uniref:hypothetical protein n=1 Tax=Streptomyces sp. NBC_01320 TaxID=2903824 RepID=UPI002E15DFBD|nr:hypothetical protein OG395_57215 [Streptomyces sp. NBC_01320]